VVGDVRVDGTDHTGLAMLCLGAVEPHRLCVFDVDSVGENALLSAVRCVGGHEAGEERVGLVGHDILDGYAGLVEGGLDD
jgi:hypothetical protein